MSCDYNFTAPSEAPKCNEWGRFPEMKRVFIDPATMEVFDEEENYLGKATRQPDGTYTVEHEET